MWGKSVFPKLMLAVLAVVFFCAPLIGGSKALADEAELLDTRSKKLK